MASVSVVTQTRLGESTRTAQPVNEPRSRFANRFRSISQNVPQQKVTGQVEAFEDFRPVGAAAFADESRQREQFTSVGPGLGGAYRPARFRADCDEIVVRPGYHAALEIE